MSVRITQKTSGEIRRALRKWDSKNREDTLITWLKGYIKNLAERKPSRQDIQDAWLNFEAYAQNLSIPESERPKINELKQFLNDFGVQFTRGVPSGGTSSTARVPVADEILDLLHTLVREVSKLKGLSPSETDSLLLSLNVLKGSGGGAAAATTSTGRTSPPRTGTVPPSTAATEDDARIIIDSVPIFPSGGGGGSSVVPPRTTVSPSAIPSHPPTGDERTRIGAIVALITNDKVKELIEHPDRVVIYDGLASKARSEIPEIVKGIAKAEKKLKETRTSLALVISDPSAGGGDDAGAILEAKKAILEAKQDVYKARFELDSAEAELKAANVALRERVLEAVRSILTNKSITAASVDAARIDSELRLLEEAESNAEEKRDAAKRVHKRAVKALPGVLSEQNALLSQLYKAKITPSTLIRTGVKDNMGRYVLRSLDTGEYYLGDSHNTVIYDAGGEPIRVTSKGLRYRKDVIPGTTEEALFLLDPAGVPINDAAGDPVIIRADGTYSSVAHQETEDEVAKRQEREQKYFSKKVATSEFKQSGLKPNKTTPTGETVQPTGPNSYKIVESATGKEFNTDYLGRKIVEAAEGGEYTLLNPADGSELLIDGRAVRVNPQGEIIKRLTTNKIKVAEGSPHKEFMFYITDVDGRTPLSIRGRPIYSDSTGTKQFTLDNLGRLYKIRLDTKEPQDPPGTTSTKIYVDRAGNPLDRTKYHRGDYRRPRVAGSAPTSIATEPVTATSAAGPSIPGTTGAPPVIIPSGPPPFIPPGPSGPPPFIPPGPSGPPPFIPPGPGGPPPGGPPPFIPPGPGGPPPGGPPPFVPKSRPLVTPKRTAATAKVPEADGSSIPTPAVAVTKGGLRIEPGSALYGYKDIISDDPRSPTRLDDEGNVITDQARLARLYGKKQLEENKKKRLAGGAPSRPAIVRPPTLEGTLAEAMARRRASTASTGVKKEHTLETLKALTDAKIQDLTSAQIEKLPQDLQDYVNQRLRDMPDDWETETSSLISCNVCDKKITRAHRKVAIACTCGQRTYCNRVCQSFDWNNRKHYRAHRHRDDAVAGQSRG